MSEALARAMELWHEYRATAPRGSIAETRRHYEQFITRFVVPSDVVTRPVDAGGVAAQWVWIDGQMPSSRVIIYVHGGGFTTGSATVYTELASYLSRDSGAPILVIDYRLAPEFPFPAAIDDVVRAYRWVLSTGTDHRSVAIAGDSAGCSLLIGAMLCLRSEGLPLPAACACASPVVDLEALGDSMDTNAGRDPVVARSVVRTLAALYLDGHDPRDPLVSPVHADLTGMPPMLVQVSTDEVLLDDAKSLVRQAQQFGVDVTFEQTFGVPHVWHLFASFLPEARSALASMAAFCVTHTRISTCDASIGPNGDVATSSRPHEE